jgi:hypothetical protein
MLTLALAAAYYDSCKIASHTVSMFWCLLLFQLSCRALIKITAGAIRPPTSVSDAKHYPQYPRKSR